MARTDREMRLEEKLQTAREAVLEQVELEVLSFVAAEDWEGLKRWSEARLEESLDEIV